MTVPCVLCLMDRGTSLSKEGGGGKLRSWRRPLQHRRRPFCPLARLLMGLLTCLPHLLFQRTLSSQCGAASW